MGIPQRAFLPQRMSTERTAGVGKENIGIPFRKKKKLGIELGEVCLESIRKLLLKVFFKNSNKFKSTVSNLMIL